MKKKTINALIEMGMQANIQGFTYIVDAMCLFEDKEWRNGKITNLYEKIGKMNDTTATRVERAIRHAFTTLIAKGNSESIEKYLTFKNMTNGNLFHIFYLRLTEDE